MKYTSMWKEIYEQPEIAEKIFGIYGSEMPKYYEKLQGKKRLILTGIGASLHACKMAQYAFFQYTPFFPTVIQSDELPYIMDSLNEDDLVIFVSQSGESYETKYYARELKEKGIPFWGITNEPYSSLASYAQEVLCLHCGKEVSSATKTNMMTFLLLLLLAVGKQEVFMEKLFKTPQKLNETLKLSQDTIRPLAEYLTKQEQLYLLGMGCSKTVAGQGALLMQEKAWIHATGTSIFDFRHGTVEVLEKGIPLVLFAMGERQREKIRKHIEFFKQEGAETFLITDEIPKWQEKNRTILISTEEEEMLALLHFLIPLQLLAEETAKEKGLRVDGFRYLSKVVSGYGEETHHEDKVI